MEGPVSQQLKVDPHGCMPDEKVLRDQVNTIENMVNLDQEERKGKKLLLPIPRHSLAGRTDCLDQIFCPFLSINFLIYTVSSAVKSGK